MGCGLFAVQDPFTGTACQDPLQTRTIQTHYTLITKFLQANKSEHMISEVTLSVLCLSLGALHKVATFPSSVPLSESSWKCVFHGAQGTVSSEVDANTGMLPGFLIPLTPLTFRGPSLPHPTGQAPLLGEEGRLGASS